MLIVFWLFLLLSPILWAISFVLLLIKRRPLIFLLNFVFCGVVIYLLWSGLDPEPVKHHDDLMEAAGDIVEGVTKGFVSMLVAAGWGMSILIYSILCSKATRPEVDMLLNRNSNPAPAPASYSSSSQPASSQSATSRSNLIVYFIIGAIILYLLAKKATEMGL